MATSKFAESLKRIRTERGLTQEQLALMLGTTKQVISRYEKEQRSPKISVAAKYANILGVSLSEINGEDEIKLPDSDEKTKQFNNEVIRMLTVLDEDERMAIFDATKRLAERHK